MYISPARSSFGQHNDDIFALVEHDIFKYSAMGKCFLVGDFNACTHIDHDFVDNDGDDFI